MSNIEKDEVSLLDIFQIISKKWIWIVISVVAALCLSFVALLFVPNVYESKVALAPSATDEQQRVSSAGGLSALGTIAGIDLGGGGDNKVSVALEILRSRKFAVDFVNNHDLKVQLFAVESWDGEQEVIDTSVYDPVRNQWVREVDPPMTTEPQDWEVYEEFSDLINIVEDESGFVEITIEGKSPTIVKKWLELLITDINEIMRERDQLELERSIDFLQDKLRSEELQSTRQALSQLLADQTRKLMMTESRDEYILEIIDPAFEPFKPSKPKKILIILGSGIISGLLASIILVFRHISSENMNRN